jgi:two-component system phosphate regulon sensor histidine kinase PhoR
VAVGWFTSERLTLAAAIAAAGAALSAIAGHAGGAALLALAGSVLAARALGQASSRASAPTQPPVAPEPAGLTALAPFLEALPDPALLIDREGRIAGSNRAARRQLQFEAAGLRLSSILRHPQLLDAVHAAAHDSQTRTVEYETTAQVEEHFRCYVAPLQWGDETAALMVFHDETARINTERTRADFLANASHELRTPLASLSLLIETILGPARNDEAARERFLGMMQGQADRMRRLIDDLLSLSRIELNEHVPPSDRADLAQIAREAADGLSPVAQDKSVTLSVSAGPSLMVSGDRFQLLQVAQNLIANAIRYSKEGGEVHVEVGLAAGRDEALERANRQWPEASRVSLLTPAPAAGRAYGFLRVADEGPGIPRRHLPRLGERFFRVERAEQAEQSGTGLGLAIVKHIINRHRGGFAVESLVGQGSAFCIYVEAAHHRSTSPALTVEDAPEPAA